MILQAKLPFDWTKPKPLPGIAPLEVSDWLHQDDAYQAQITERKRLIQDEKQEVIAKSSGSEAACAELLDYVLETQKLAGNWAPDTDPDNLLSGRRSDSSCPLEILGKSVQEDMCILEKSGDEHVMTAAVLCFPASWMLSEKIGQPMTHIHGTVADYDPNVQRRVQRLFDGIKPGRPLWRWNALWNDEPTLFQPRSVSDPRPPADPKTAPYLRCERQCLVRLPVSGAVVFSIHTYVLSRQDAFHRDALPI